MADLDDFFAKKDRKKSKGGKKFTTTEELAKKLEETHRREKEKVKENKKLLSSQNVDGDGEPGSERKDEDEWKDFEEEKKDYTNLKIQNLQISETANADNGDGDDDENEMVENEDGVMVSRKKQPSGPWMSVPQAPQAEEPVIREESRSQPPPPTDGGGGGGKSGYVPPHLRNAPSHYAPATSFSPSPSSYSSPNSYSSSMHHQPLSSSRFKSRAAPDITNEAYFPTLSAANNDTPNTAWGRRREDGRGFEEVRNARTNTSTYNPKVASSGQGPNLSLGNKWDALRDQS